MKFHTCGPWYCSTQLTPLPCPVFTFAPGEKNTCLLVKILYGEEENPEAPCYKTSLYIYRRVASMALSRPTILRLLPRPSLPRIKPAAGMSESSQCLKTAFMSRGTPSITTVVTGMKGRSSSETARIPYSCAKRRAVENA
jgi:hypothetical protein